jgi:hypothetical protein
MRNLGVPETRSKDAEIAALKATKIELVLALDVVLMHAAAMARRLYPDKPLEELSWIERGHYARINAGGPNE